MRSPYTKGASQGPYTEGLLQAPRGFVHTGFQVFFPTDMGWVLYKASIDEVYKAPMQRAL